MTAARPPEYAQPTPTEAPEVPSRSLWIRFLTLFSRSRNRTARHEEMVRIAQNNPPPQEWFEEDVDSLRRRRTS
jgi:hypothetical protein